VYGSLRASHTPPIAGAGRDSRGNSRARCNIMVGRMNKGAEIRPLVRFEAAGSNQEL
jgi:hypothetical protein